MRLRTSAASPALPLTLRVWTLLQVDLRIADFLLQKRQNICIQYDWTCYSHTSICIRIKKGTCFFSVKVIYAINAGGEAHVDVHGISYRKDPLLGRGGRGGIGSGNGDGGTASAFGRTLLIARSPIPDQILYQTERCVGHHNSRRRQRFLNNDTFHKYYSVFIIFGLAFFNTKMNV